MNLLDGNDQLPDEDTLRKELIAKWADKSKEELLEAKINSDLHIKTVERENGTLRKDYLTQREELLAKAKFEEYLDRIQKSSNPENFSEPKEKEVESHRYDPNEMKTLFREEYQQAKLAEKESDNFNKVQNKLRERFGNNYQNILRDQKETLGLSDTEINSLAKKSPEAFFRMMGITDQAKDSFQAPPRSGQRNDSFAPRGEPLRDWNYYQELKKTNPKMYLDPKISHQMQEDAIALGDRFGLPSD